MDQISQARDSLQKKRKQKKESKAKYIQNLPKIPSFYSKEEVDQLRSRISNLENHIIFLNKLISKYADFFNDYFDKENKSNNILKDLYKLYFDKDSGFFSIDIFQMCCDIYKSSAESYNILKKYIQFLPSKIEIEKFLNENTPNIPENITNVQKIPKIIVEYKKENKILSTQKIFCCLAVDALFFKPDVQIDSNGIVSGMNKEYELGKKTFSLFSRDVKYLILSSEYFD